MAKKQGNFTFIMENSPSVLSFAGVGGKKEADGPLAPYFDILNDDAFFGKATWEKAESEMQSQAVAKVLSKARMSAKSIDMVFSGDLLNQCIASTFGLCDLGVAHLGIYGACSTMAQGMGLGAMLVDSGAVNNTLAVTSSHFCTAERQYRFPLEYGGQRPPTSQWTVTGAGAVILGKHSTPPFVKSVCFGVIQDKGIKDANNMGAAMAPAAASTIKNFFEDTLTNVNNYDLILTGDLGKVGSDLLYELLMREGYDIQNKHQDCGLLVYDRQKQDVHAGGSGAACSATVLTTFILPSMRAGRVKNMLFIATGALLSPTSVQQKQSIPGIAHLVHLSINENAEVS